MAEYCLRWNNHQPNLVTVFSELLTSEALVDVTLATDGQFIQAHKLVLSACSAYFKDLFGSNPCTHPIVFLKDIRFEDLRTVVDFIYKGEVNVLQERLQDVLKTAESLKIKGLADKPLNFDEHSSQSRGHHLSSSFSSQRSSLTDSREHVQSLETEEGPEASRSSPPAYKRRKVTPQGSAESVKGTNNQEEEERNANSEKDDQARAAAPSSTDEDGKANSSDLKEIKKENDLSHSEVNPEYQESRAADAMLLLQGSSSENEGGGGGSIPSSNSIRSSDASSNVLGAHSQGSVMCRWGMSGLSPSTSTLEALLDNPLSSSSSSSPPIFMVGAPSPSPSPISPSSSHPSHFFFAAAAAAAAATGGYHPCPGIPPSFFMPYHSWQNQFRRMSPNMLLAIDAVRSGRMGFTQAGKTFGVNGRTLWVYYRKLGYEVHNTFRGRRNKPQPKIPLMPDGKPGPALPPDIKVSIVPKPSTSTSNNAVSSSSSSSSSNNNNNNNNNNNMPSNPYLNHSNAQPSVTTGVQDVNSVTISSVNPSMMPPDVNLNPFNPVSTMKSFPPHKVTNLQASNDPMKLSVPDPGVEVLPPPSPSEILSDITPAISMNGQPTSGTHDSSQHQQSMSYNQPHKMMNSVSSSKNEMGYSHNIPNPSQCRYSGNDTYANQTNFLNCLYSVPNNANSGNFSANTMHPFGRDPSAGIAPSTGHHPHPHPHPHPHSHYVNSTGDPALIDNDEGPTLESILESCNFRNMWGPPL